MGKRGAVRLVFACLLVLALTALSASAAYKESVHEKWHKHGDEFTIDDISFKVKTGGSRTKVLVTVNDNGVIVENGTCVDKFNMSICLNDIKAPDLELHKLYDPEDYEYKVEIEFYLADIVIQRHFDERELLIGERTNVEMEIQNQGSVSASDIHFRDSYPKFEVVSVFGCSFDSHNVTWTGILKPNQRKTCSYVIKAKEPVSFKSKAEAVYNAGVGTRVDKASSSELTINVADYEMETKALLNSTNMPVGDEFLLNITLKNREDDESLQNIGLSIHVPEGLKPIEYSPSLSASGSLIKWNGYLGSSDEKEFWVRFRAEHSGENTIRISSNYNIGSLSRSLILNKSINASIDMLKLQYIEIPETVFPGENKKIEVNIQNPSSRYNFTKIKADIDTNLPFILEPKEFEAISGKRFKSIVAKNFTFPSVSETTGYRIYFNISYKTEFGEEIFLKETKIITVNLPGGAQSAKSKPSPVRERIIEKVEEIGAPKFTFWFTAFAMVFLFSSLHFIRRMVKKVRQYEDYEK